MSLGNAAVSAQPVLTLHFQGICAFLRNHQKLSDTTEVTAIFVAGERANENPRLCAHAPVLVFQASDFLKSTGQVTHTTALLPDAASHCAGLGLWSLTGRDIRVSGAPAGDLTLASSFGMTAGLDQLLPSGKGAASPRCLDAQPPADRLVGGRMFLTSGRLSASAVIGDTGRANDQWVFDDELAHPSSGTPVIFTQEVQYDYFTSAPTNTVGLEAGPMGSPATETLTLTAGGKPLANSARSIWGRSTTSGTSLPTMHCWRARSRRASSHIACARVESGSVPAPVLR